MAEGQIQQVQDTQERLRRIYELALTVAGNPVEVCDRIVKIIAELFGVRVAIVERLEADKAVTISMYLDGRLVHGGGFELAGTPCANVRETRSFCSFSGATGTFPQDKFLKDHGLDFYLGVPVVSSGGEVIAIINAMHDRRIHVSEGDKLFLEAMASRVRQELEREQQAHETNVIRVLLDMSREISRVRDLDETLQLLANYTKGLSGADIAAVVTTDDLTGTTSWKAIAGSESNAFLKVKFAPGTGAAGRAITARQTVILKGIGESAELSAEEFPFLTSEGVRNALAVPLTIGERILGALVVGYRSDLDFTDQQIRIAEAISAQAAVAIENARLFTALASVNKQLLEAGRLKTEMIAELSTPIIPIWDRVLLAPIIGSLNTERAEALTDALLQRTTNGGAQVVILDITGASAVDTEAAQHLRNTVTAVRVLGASCIITGIRGVVAQTLIHLGITLEDIQTRRKLSDGLQLALDIISNSPRQ